MPINRRQHDRLVRAHQDEALHYDYHLCTCSSTSDPNRANAICKVCYGKGRYWDNEKTIKGVMMGLHSDQGGRFLLQWGLIQPEDMIFIQSPLATTRVGDGDLIIPKWKKGFPFQGELLTRSVEYGAEKLAYQAINGKIDLLRVVDPNLGTKTDYVQGADFTLAVDWQTIQWVAGRGPELGETYAVSYNARYEFVAFNPPAQRFELGEELGQKVMLRKRHLPWPKFTL